MSLMSWWRERTIRNRIKADGRDLVREARQILKRHRGRVPEPVATELSSSADAVDRALAAGDWEESRRAVDHLGDLVEQHLGFARKSTIREYAESIFIAVAIACVLRAFVVEAFQIPSGSMIPTLEVGDHIFVSKFSYGFSIPFTNKKVLEWRDPSRGDVIVFKYPLDLNTDYIKRVVGLPGDVIEVKKAEVYVNGQLMARERLGPYKYAENEGDARDCELWQEHLSPEPHLLIQENRQGGGRDLPPTKVPPHAVFVMGDNRDNSYDSRFWGTVDLDLIKGRALIIWWSRAQASSKGFFDSVRWDRFFHVVR